MLHFHFTEFCKIQRSNYSIEFIKNIFFSKIEEYKNSTLLNVELPDLSFEETRLSSEIFYENIGV